jgi:Fe-S-cluster containining protein
MNEETDTQRLTDLLNADEKTLAENMLEPETMAAAFDETRKLLQVDGGEPQLLKIVENAISIAAGLWQDLESESPAAECHKGCSWCCRQLVAVTTPEAIYAARFIRATFDHAEIQALRKHLADHVAAAAGLSSGERVDRNMPCPFLQDDVCSIYDARPIQCRGVHSESEAFCRHLLDERTEVEAQLEAGTLNNPFLLIPLVLHNSVQVGMAGALGHAGNKTELLDLAASTLIALGNADIAKSWLDGKPVFEAARLQHTEGGAYATNSKPIA